MLEICSLSAIAEAYQNGTIWMCCETGLEKLSLMQVLVRKGGEKGYVTQVLVATP